MNNESSEILG